MTEFLASAALDYITEGFQIINHNWHYLYLNHAAVQHSKFRKEELMGFSILEKYPGIEKTEMFQALKTCMDHQINTKFENEFTYPDGSKGWFELSIQSIPAGICILSIDISKRKIAFDQLFDLNINLEERIAIRNAELEHKNKYVMDSLNYAKKIQKAFLQHKSEVHGAFRESLLLYKPKDIVSGDFYFCHEFDDKIILVAADCTGHGVPGALVSMIGLEKIKNLILKSKDASELLLLLNNSIIKTLNQSTNDNCNDGMDIAVCVIDKHSLTVSFAGANIPLLLIRNDHTHVSEIKATKKAIGGNTREDQHFDSHDIKLQHGDTFYICSDGYADTFGGAKGKKLMKRRFKEILLDIQQKTMKEQEVYLDRFIEKWKGGEDQIDDILVIGVRI